MNKKIFITTNIKILSLISVLIIVLTFLFRRIHIRFNYYYNLVNIFLLINIIILFVVIIGSIYVYKKNIINYKPVIIFLLIFLVFLFNNIFTINIINDPYQRKYNKILDVLTLSCERFSCETYDVTNKKNLKLFELKKNYIDYNGNQNYIYGYIIYDYNSIKSMQFSIISDKNLYSSELIKKEIDLFLIKYEINVDDKKILDAFNNRFIGEIKDNNIIYKVDEIYDSNKELIEIKTKIKINL